MNCIYGLSIYDHMQIAPDKQADLLSESHAKFWQEYRIVLSPPETTSEDFDFKKVLQVIEGKIKSPSESAGIPSSELSNTGKMIDSVFSTYQTSYREMLKAATEEDMRNLSKLIPENTHSPLKAGGLSAIPSAGTGAGAGVIGGPIGVAGGAAVGGAVGFITGLALGFKGKNLYLAQQGSRQRLRCMHQIAGFEKGRVKQTINTLQIRIEVLVENIRMSHKHNFVHSGEEKEQAQLQKLLSHVKISGLSSNQQLHLFYSIYREALKEGVKIHEPELERNSIFDDYSRLHRAHMRLQVSALDENKLGYLHYLVYQETVKAGVKISDPDWGRNHLYDNPHRLHRALIRLQVSSLGEEKLRHLHFLVYQEAVKARIKISDPDWGRNHLFDDYNRLNKAFLRMQVASLDENKLRYLHYLVYREAAKTGFKITDPEWGKNHLFDDFDRLHRALVRVQVSSLPEKDLCRLQYIVYHEAGSSGMQLKGLDWGKSHLLDDYNRLSRAMVLVQA